MSCNLILRLRLRSHLHLQTKRLCRAWLKEAQWSSTGYVPPLEEYLSVAGETTGYPALTITSFVGMGETATRQAFEWMLGFPKILRALCTITRLRDDVVSHEVRMQLLME